MTTSISEIIQTEKFIRNELSPDERLVFEAKLLVNDDLKTNTFLHRVVHRLVRLHHRRKLKAEIENIHVRLLRDPVNTGLREAVNLFKS